MDDARIHLQQQQAPAPAQPPQQEQQQEQQIAEQDECVAEASGSAAAAWGTLEELFLASAVGRHGTGDWSAVASELQSRARLFNLPATSFSSETCKNKYDTLNGRYASLGNRNGGNGRDKESDNLPPWFEELRKRRVAQLKRELERHDGSILTLTNKLKRLKAERAQSLQGANKQQQQQQQQQQTLEKLVAAAVDSAKPTDAVHNAPESSGTGQEPQPVVETAPSDQVPPKMVNDAETSEPVVHRVKENEVATAHEVSALHEEEPMDISSGEKRDEQTYQEPVNLPAMTTKDLERPSEAVKEDAMVVEEANPEKVEGPDLEQQCGKTNDAVLEAEERMDVDSKEQGLQKLELDTDVDTRKPIETVDKSLEARQEKVEGERPGAGDVDMVCMKNEAVDVRSDDGKSEKFDSDAAADKDKPLKVMADEAENKNSSTKLEEIKATDAPPEVSSQPMEVAESNQLKEPIIEVAPAADTTELAGPVSNPESPADQHELLETAAVAPEPAGDVGGSKAAVFEQKAPDSNFVESASKDVPTVEVTEAAAGSPAELEVSKEKKDEVVAPPIVSDVATNSQAVTSVELPSDTNIKVVGETGQLVVDIVGEQSPGESSKPAPEEKESSSNAVQQLSCTDGKVQVAELKEKSDESQGGTRQAESADKIDNLVVSKPGTQQDVGSPVSINEGSASAHEQSKDNSQVERSDVGSQADGLEDTSPMSGRSKDGRISGKLQPLLECLRMISNHKLAAFFKQKQESQEDPRYGQVVRRHIDLNMIRTRLEEGAYSGSLEFFRDILLVFNNSIVFYPRESQEHAAALVLRKVVMEEMDKLLQAETVVKQDKPTTRKRDVKKATTETSAGTSSKTGTKAARPAQAIAAAPAPTGLEVSTSDNSKSKSASLSMGGVPSSKGGEEDDTREGEPEVEGKSKPLKAYGRKNRGVAAASAGEQKTGGKGVTREKPLDAIVKKIGKAEEKDKAANNLATTKEKEKAKDKDGGKAASSQEGGKSEVPATTTAGSTPTTTATTTTVPGTTKSTSKTKSAPGTTTDGLTATTTTTTGAVRGVRNKRTAKDGSQRPAAAAKRTRRV